MAETFFRRFSLPMIIHYKIYLIRWSVSRFVKAIYVFFDVKVSWVFILLFLKNSSMLTFIFWVLFQTASLLLDVVIFAWRIYFNVHCPPKWFITRFKSHFPNTLNFPPTVIFFLYFFCALAPSLFFLSLLVFLKAKHFYNYGRTRFIRPSVRRALNGNSGMLELSY